MHFDTKVELVKWSGVPTGWARLISKATMYHNVTTLHNGIGQGSKYPYINNVHAAASVGLLQQVVEVERNV